MQVNLSRLGLVTEKKLMSESKISGNSIGSIVERIVTEYYNSVIMLSSITQYDSINGTLFNVSTSEKINLSKKENGLLAILYRNKNVIVDPKYLYSVVWDVDIDLIEEAYKFTLRNFIKKVRDKLGDTVRIKNKSGHGYALMTDI